MERSSRKISFFDTKQRLKMLELFSNASKQRMAQLTSTELHYFKSKTKLLEFVRTGNIDKIMTVLTKLGHRPSLIIYNDPEDVKRLVKGAYDQYKDKEIRADIIDDMMRSDVFVTDSISVANSLIILSQNAHSDFLHINPNIMIAANKVRQAAIISRDSKSMTYKYHQSENAYDIPARIVYNTMMARNFITAVEGLDEPMFRVLMCLFFYRGKYISLNILATEFKGLYNRISLGMFLNKLFDMKLLERLPGNKRGTSWTITALGILSVGRIMEKILNDSLNK